MFDYLNGFYFRMMVTGTVFRLIVKGIILMVKWEMNFTLHSLLRTPLQTGEALLTIMIEHRSFLYHPDIVDRTYLSANSAAITI